MKLSTLLHRFLNRLGSIFRMGATLIYQSNNQRTQRLQSSRSQLTEQTVKIKRLWER